MYVDEFYVQGLDFVLLDLQVAQLSMISKHPPLGAAASRLGVAHGGIKMLGLSFCFRYKNNYSVFTQCVDVRFDRKCYRNVG